MIITKKIPYFHAQDHMELFYFKIIKSYLFILYFDLHNHIYMKYKNILALMLHYDHDNIDIVYIITIINFYDFFCDH